MSRIGLNRMRFYSKARVSDPQVSIDEQLQEFLQMITDNGGVVISVQETRVTHYLNEATIYHVEWAEFLIVSQQSN